MPDEFDLLVREFNADLHRRVHDGIMAKALLEGGPIVEAPPPPPCRPVSPAVPPGKTASAPRRKPRLMVSSAKAEPAPTPLMIIPAKVSRPLRPDEVRRRMATAGPEILAKAMREFEAGQISSLDVARLEARLNNLQGGVHPSALLPNRRGARS